VTLDPTSNTGARDTPASAGAAPPPAAKPAEEAAAPPPPPPPPAAVQSAAPAPASAPTGTTRRRFGATVAGQTIVGPAPNVMPGIAIYGMAALDRDGLWAPAIFVGATHVWRTDIAETDGSASFALDAASLDACPLRLGWPRLAVRPCASALAGRLS